MIGHRLVREDIVGTALNAIKNLKHIWPSGLPHLCQHVLATHSSVIYTEQVVVISRCFLNYKRDIHFSFFVMIFLMHAPALMTELDDGIQIRYHSNTPVSEPKNLSGDSLKMRFALATKSMLFFSFQKLLGHVVHVHIVIKQRQTPTLCFWTPQSL